MATKLSTIASDSTKESQGVWRTYPGTDLMCRIARLGNPEYDRAAKRLRRSAKSTAAADGTLTEREAKDAIAPAVAKYILLEWKNLQGDDGKDISYSEGEAVKLLQTPEYHDFYDWVLMCAQDSNAFRKEVEEEAKGNLLPGSGGY